MELKNIEAFLKVVEKGSFSLAADSMFISQPTISSRIHKLEQELNTTLFDRNGGKKAILTSEGGKIYPFYKEGYYLITQGSNAILSRNKSLNAVRISSPNHMSQHILQKILNVLYNNYPETIFSVKIGVTSRIMQDINDDETDIGFIYYEGAENNNKYSIVPVTNVETVVVASPRHPLTERPSLNVADLNGEKIFVYAKTFITTVISDRYFKQSGLINYEFIEIANVEWMKIMISNGLGIAVLQKKIVEKEIETGTFVELTFEKPLPKTPISIIYSQKIPQDMKHIVTKTITEIFGV